MKFNNYNVGCKNLKHTGEMRTMTKIAWKQGTLAEYIPQREEPRNRRLTEIAASMGIPTRRN